MAIMNWSQSAYPFYIAIFFLRFSTNRIFSKKVALERLVGDTHKC